jgi:hypothetical protein
MSEGGSVGVCGCGRCTTKNTKSTKEERESGREGDVKVEEAGRIEAGAVRLREATAGLQEGWKNAQNE